MIKFDRANEGQTNRIILAGSQGRVHPIIGLWPIGLEKDLQQALEGGTRKIRAWTDRHDTKIVDFADHHINGQRVDPFFNINTPEDLLQAEKIMGQR